MEQQKRNSASLGIIMVLVALAFVIGPPMLPFIKGTSQVILMGFGIGLLFLGSTVVTITRLYQTASADEAFVRTGMGGSKSIIDGGSLIIPLVHKVVSVLLSTMRLDVMRKGKDALLTKDNLRVDVAAEFYIKVNKKSENVISAATSLGMNAVHKDSIMLLVEHKLVSALRTVATSMPLEELNTKREDFARQVQEIVSKDLDHNGLTLESVTISSLDQTSTEFLRGDDNIFDAQGLKRISEITQSQRVAKNAIERQADQKVKAQDVERDQFIFTQEQSRAEAEAKKNAAIQMAQAEATKGAQTFQAAQEGLIGVAKVEMEKSIQLAGVQKEQELEVQGKKREQAAQTADIERQKATQLAEQQKQIEVAEAEKDRANAETQRLQAETEREKQKQVLLTVEMTQTAEREKARTVINKQAQIEQTRLENQMNADVTAYAAVKSAEGEQSAAEMKAKAQLQLAEADKKAKVFEAEGTQATAMVPVNVRMKEVDVNKAQVEVERQKLENQAAFADISKDLQIKLAEIEANKLIKIAFAEAQGKALAAANITIWGDPNTMAQMSESFYTGQKNGHLVGGVVSSLPEVIQEKLTGIVEAGTELLNYAAGSTKKGGNSHGEEAAK